MNKSITHIFFDLDRTLWDFESNSHDELMAIWKRNGLHQKGISLPEEFIKVYKQINEECWEAYRKDEMTKDVLRSERFRRTLAYYGIDDSTLSEEIGIQYVSNSPQRTKLVDHSYELLDYLSNKYELHMITNGFEEVQHIKLANADLDKYFGEVITSEMAGVKKPAQKIFDLAIEKSGAAPASSVYVGDDLVVDVLGAINAGWHAIYYNPHRVTHNHSTLADVQCLSEIKAVL
ncbi:YjjG family noncanonical pyrimidine nucleotidase [Parvicella tangerina]|uniref:Pyrimidine 5'-nucleotidase YjjG n=1 Tax=Parvicella tangerina TaxID=2829795 RepID=A0A916NC88_9FLAO|nr:YjjG family noncanonical pyrimidine nucleotidase [Parvicella tangerina]CAG5082551.1 Pyrimidine 5'-nucleotidase YjjG [Parvicella tangerina]